MLASHIPLSHFYGHARAMDETHTHKWQQTSGARNRRLSVTSEASHERGTIPYDLAAFHLFCIRTQAGKRRAGELSCPHKRIIT